MSPVSTKGPSGGAYGREAFFPQGALIYPAGASGRAWRIREGSVRLDRLSSEPGGCAGPQGPSFAGLYVKGDIVGVEAMLLETYTFSATALVNCRLEPWPAGNAKPAGTTILRLISAAEHRRADLLEMRTGGASDRVRRLLALLAQPSGTVAQPSRVVLPHLRDMADITALTVETVSRALSAFRREGLIDGQERRRGRFSSRECDVHTSS